MNTYILSIPSGRMSWFALGAVACALSLMYIVQINKIVEFTYQAAEYEESIRALDEETAALEMRSGEMFSISQLEHMAQALRFERVGAVNYVRIGGGTVAQNSK